MTGGFNHFRKENMILLHCGKLLWIISLTFSVVSAQTLTSEQQNDGTELSLNVDKVWEKNITGRGVVVAVVDEGLNYHHQDLVGNYEPRASHDFIDGDDYPSPVFNGHGTKCAGIIAGRFNGTCRTGIAYNAKAGGIRLFTKSRASDAQEAAAFGFKQNLVDIYSNSWGPLDNGYSVRGPGPKAKKALEAGVIMGRKGRGSIFVFSSGNGGIFGDSCAFDGYVNSIYTIAIGAVRKDGRIPRYGESCAAIMASTFGDDMVTCSGFSTTECVNNFGATSAAAAMASGIIALALEANEKLTWRDLQHLIVRTNTQKGLNVPHEEWTVNGAGLMVHPSVGFGLMNAQKLVDAALGWKTVPSQAKCFIKLERSIRNFGQSLQFKIQTTLNSNCSRIKYIENVKVKLSLTFLPRAFMLMYLTSPSGTISQLLYPRVFDAITRRNKYKNLVVSSLHYWGEDPNGNWTVSFKNSRPSFGHSGVLSKFKIALYGTEKDPLSGNQDRLPSGVIKCGKKKFWVGYGNKCCASSITYNSDIYECCNDGKIVEKVSMCGAKPYNKCRKICCQGQLYSKFTPCCSGRIYDKENELCCAGRVYNKKYKSCCNGQAYSKWYAMWLTWRYRVRCN